jgi:hypothetical protein
MCFLSGQPFEVGSEHMLLISLAAPLSDVVLVKGRVVWVDSADPAAHRTGVRFVASSKGWFGPDEEE